MNNEVVRGLIADATEVHDNVRSGVSYSVVDSRTLIDSTVRECIRTMRAVQPGYKDYRDQIENDMRDACIVAIKQHFGIDDDSV